MGFMSLEEPVTVKYDGVPYTFAWPSPEARGVIVRFNGYGFDRYPSTAKERAEFMPRS